MTWVCGIFRATFLWIVLGLILRQLLRMCIVVLWLLHDAFIDENMPHGAMQQPFSAPFIEGQFPTKCVTLQICLKLQRPAVWLGVDYRRLILTPVTGIEENDRSINLPVLYDDVYGN